MEGRIEKHTLSSGQNIERRETYTSTLFKREGGLFGTTVHVVPSCQIMIEQYNMATNNSSLITLNHVLHP